MYGRGIETDVRLAPGRSRRTDPPRPPRTSTRSSSSWGTRACRVRRGTCWARSPRRSWKGADRDVLLCRTVVQIASELAPGEGGVIERRGEKLAVFVDEGGEQHLMSARCTHLGCTVAWNPGERTFDCPCHGSRFSRARRGRERAGRPSAAAGVNRGALRPRRAGTPSGRGSRPARCTPIAVITCARGERRIWPSSSSETRGTPEGRTSHASFTRRKYGFATAVISAIIADQDPDRDPDPPVREHRELQTQQDPGQHDRADRDVHRDRGLARQADQVDDLPSGRVRRGSGTGRPSRSRACPAAPGPTGCAGAGSTGSTWRDRIRRPAPQNGS